MSGLGDTTGWCKRAEHARCDGTLHTGTGYHWWCICDCHPEPPIHDSKRADAHRALAVWRAGRSGATTP